jgi:hypothetical protein
MHDIIDSIIRTHYMKPESENKLIGIGILLLVLIVALYGVNYFRLRQSAPPVTKTLTEEQKLDILRQLHESSTGPTLSEKQKIDILASLTKQNKASTSTKDVSTQEAQKLETLRSLHE